MLSSLRVAVTNERRLVWSELLQWIALFFIFFVLLEIGMFIFSMRVKPSKKVLVGHHCETLSSNLAISQQRLLLFIMDRLRRLFNLSGHCGTEVMLHCGNGLVIEL